jgi:hypothetical protein
MLQHEVLELANDAVSPLWRSFDRHAPAYAGVYSGTTIDHPSVAGSPEAAVR